MIWNYILFSDQIIEEAVKCNQENDSVLLANTILVHIGVLKVINTYIYTGSVELGLLFYCLYKYINVLVNDGNNFV